MTRISTYGQMNSTLASVMRLQAEVAEAQTQTSSGKKSDSYQGLGSDTRQLLNLENQLARSLEYVDQAEVVSARVETMYSAVDKMIDLLTDYATTLSSAISADMAEDTSLNSQSETALETFADLLNVQVDGRYLFSGNMTDTAPIDLSTYTAQTYPSTASTDYYQGDGAVASFKASDSLTISYGVTADDEAFEQAIRAISLGANASEDPMDKEALGEAYDLVQEAIDALAVVQTKLSASSSTLETEIDIQTEVQLQLEAMASNIEDVDVAEALSRMKSLQTQLEASYSAISIINEMNLFEYL